MTMRLIGQTQFISESITDMFGCDPINLCGGHVTLVIEEIPIQSYDNKLTLSKKAILLINCIKKHINGFLSSYTS